jgi:hypothetical protein
MVSWALHDGTPAVLHVVRFPPDHKNTTASLSAQRLPVGAVTGFSQVRQQRMRNGAGKPVTESWLSSREMRLGAEPDRGWHVPAA